jgi:hypothetical protein
MTDRPGQANPGGPQRARGAQHPSGQRTEATQKNGAPKSKSRQLIAVKDGTNGGAPPPDPPDKDFSDDEQDPLGDFLDNRAGVHEELGEPIPDELLRNGAIGAGLVALAALVFAILPDPQSMRGSSFLIIGENLAADLTQTGKALAGTLFVVGLLLLAANGVLAAMKPRLPVKAHYACAGQLGLGACAVLPAGLVLAILIGSLIFWLAVICFALWALGVMAGG